MKNPKFAWRGDERAASGPVSAILILLIVMSLLGMIVTTYVPTWTEEREMSHMRDVADQFLRLRETVDGQVAGNMLGATMTTRVRLGEEGGIVFGFGKTLGDISNNPFNGSLTIHDYNYPDDTYARSRGNLSFYSRNMYYIQQQYTYEFGAVIVGQGKTAAVKVPPRFEASRSGTWINVSFGSVALAGDQVRVGGSPRSVAIQTKLLSVSPNKFEDALWNGGKNITINLTTAYPATWSNWLNRTLNESGLNYSASAAGNVAGNYTLGTSGSLVTLRIWGVTRLTADVAVAEVKIV